MQTLTHPKIVLAVELGPELLRRKEHVWPELGAENRAQSSDIYWRAFLADVGIVDVEPVALGEWQVSALETSDKILEILIRNHVFIGLEEDSDDEAAATPSAARDRANWAELDWELFIALSGGFYWLDGDKIVFQPQCCSDLSNFQNWSRILELQDGESCSIWIGHPSLPCRRLGEWLHWGAYTDSGPPFSEETFAYRLARAAFEGIFQEMTRQMQQFQQRLIHLLHQMRVPEPERLAEVLCPLK